MPRTVSPEDWKSLQAMLPQGAILTHPVELIPYEVDGSLGQGAAEGVVLARSTEEVAKIVRWAAERKIPVIARGAGTGLSGGAVAPHGGIILSLARMKQILELDEAGRSVVVQPGVVHQTLDEFVKTKGLYYPPDPASGRACTIGGNLAENAGGPHCFKYGVTTNYVNGLRVVLADGRIIHTGGRAFDYPEYDLTGLLVGSEGTLGIVTEAELRLMRNIPGIKTLMAIFNSVEEAGEAVSAVIARGLIPATLEMMDRNMIGIVENYAHAGLPTDAEALLIIEADGYPQSLEPQMAEIVQVMQERRARELRLAQNAQERDRIWFARKSAFGAIAQISPAYLIVDGTVPRSKLALALAEINKICARHNLRVGYVFHAGDGNLHPLILFDPRDPDMVRRVHAAGDEVMALCVQIGGTITGEHGVGSEKRQYMRLMFNDDELRAMREIKAIFDPQDILNPGKILPNQRMGESANGRMGESANQRMGESANQRMGEAANGRSGEWASGGSRSTQYAVHSTQDAVAAVRDWLAAGQRIRVRGGGTKSRWLPPADVTLATGPLTGIQAYALNDLYVTVAAGTRLADLQAELARDGVFVPLASPWAESTVGGIVATNFNAPLRTRYGALRDLVLAMTVVLPDGRVIRAGKPVVKNVAGYDLVKLFIGSHGTLGLISDVTLKIWPLPRARRTVVVPLPTLVAGLNLATQLLRVCLVSSALLLCRGCDLPGLDAPYGLVYTAEGVAEDVETELAQVRGVLDGLHLPQAIPADAFTGSDFWAGWLRAAADELVVRAGVAPKDLSRFLVEVAPVVGDAPVLADVPTGMVYTRGVAVEPLRRAAQALGGYATVLGCTPSSAIGPGVDPWGHKPDGLDLMHGIKAQWDPQRLFNPGAFL
ncbi:MAG: FAD-binding oxidoreductase [Anaerolineae bacterium]